MFRFSIRDLVLTTLVVGLALAWWIDRTRLAEQAAASSERASVLETAFEATGWRISHDKQGNEISRIHISRK